MRSNKRSGTAGKQAVKGLLGAAVLAYVAYLVYQMILTAHRF